MTRSSGPLVAGHDATSPGERLGPATLCAAALAVPLFYVPALSSVFAEPKLALLSVAGALGLAGAILRWTETGTRPRLERPLAVAVGALLLTTVIAACAAWARGSPGAPYAGVELGRWLAVVGVGLAAAQASVDDRWRRRLLTSIQASAGLVSIIGLLQHLQILPLAIPIISVPGSTFGNRNIAAEAVAMSLPFGIGLLALRRRPSAEADAAADSPAPILFLLAVEVVYLSATRTRGAWLGAAAGIAVFLWLRRRALPRSAWGVAAALGVAALAAAVIPGRSIPRDLADTKRFESGEHVVREALDPSSPVVRARLGLWRRTLAMYRAHPWLGVGPGNFVVFFPRYAEPGARAEGVMSPDTVPRRAHQDLLERLAETGPLGLGALLSVYAAALAIAIRRARGADRDDVAAPRPLAGASDERQGKAALAAAAAGALVALLACGLTGFPLAMPATALLLGVSLGLLAGEGARDRAAPAVAAARGARARAAVTGGFATVAAWLLALVIVAGVTIASARVVARSYWLARAQAAMRNPSLGAPVALDDLRRAERCDPGRFQVALETAFVLVRLGRDAEALVAVDRALAIEPDSANAWSVRAEAALGAGDARRAADDARHALGLLFEYPDPLVTLARAEARLGNRGAEQEARVRLVALSSAGNGRARQLLESLGAEGGPR